MGLINDGRNSAYISVDEGMVMLGAFETKRRMFDTLAFHPEAARAIARQLTLGADHCEPPVLNESGIFPVRTEPCDRNCSEGAGPSTHTPGCSQRGTYATMADKARDEKCDLRIDRARVIHCIRASHVAVKRNCIDLLGVLPMAEKADQ